ELKGIDENRNDDELRSVLARNANQRQMALVEKAHRRDETDDATRGTRTTDHGARFFNRPRCLQFTFGIGTTTESPYSFFSSSVLLMWKDSVVPLGNRPLRTSSRNRPIALRMSSPALA